ncbi:TPA: hypothetical protein EYP66_16050 [Candidatus Poribacteria bacterium]|nr:hypothetical protein [Candidatus Poribacteria bacterium]
MQISEQTRWLVTVSLGVAAIVIGIVGIVVGARTLNGAFRRAESTIESGFSQTHSTLSTVEETSVIMALGSKNDRPAWSNFLRRAKTEAIDKGYVSVAAKGFVITEIGEKRLAPYTQEQIQEVIKESPDVAFEELAARVIERLGVSRLSDLAKAHDTSLNEMIAIMAGFAEKIRT